MEKKKLTDLNKSDMLDRPVWEHWAEDNLEYVIPTDLNGITDNGTIGYIVLTDFILSNGTKLKGFCSPQDPSGLDYIQPCIFTERGQMEIWKDSSWTKTDKEKELQKLGLVKDKVFPIVYRTLVKCDGEFHTGTLVDFNREK